jgi:P27 family predicted phage terminase small subunit
MARGRKPTPTALNNLKGDPGKRRRQMVEPQPGAGIPECPAFLDDVAKAEWQATCEILGELGVLTKADRNALAMYCESWSRYCRATEQVRKFGDVILSPKTKFPIPSPYQAIANKAMEQCHKLLTEFGLTPSARARLAVRGDQVQVVIDPKWKGLIK